MVRSDENANASYLFRSKSFYRRKKTLQFIVISLFDYRSQSFNNRSVILHNVTVRSHYKSTSCASQADPRPFLPFLAKRRMYS